MADSVSDMSVACERCWCAWRRAGMLAAMAEAQKPWYLRTSKRWQHLQSVPWNRLWLFATAVFLLFTVIGFYQDLIRMGTIPYAIVLVIASICGLNAVLWIVVVSRFSWRVLVPLILFQFLLGPLMSWMGHWMGTTFALKDADSTAGVRFAGTCILVAVVISYILFVNFFRAEGRETLRIRTQLELAHGIQKTLVPPVSLQTERFEVYGISKPSDEVGGDLVDALRLPNGDLIAYVADIAGHGLPAGILMGMLKTAARTALLDAAIGHPSETLPLLLEKLNRVLPDVKEPQMYATLTAFRLNADGSAWYATAASPPILHWSARGDDARLMAEEQFPLGLLPVSGFTGEGIELAPGDLVAVATDGVLEVCNRDGEEFGIERVERAIEADARGGLEGLAESILRSARAFGKQADDQTLLLIRRL
jgi:serine phosphatase RsbU (regulator of sigma subunit)